MKKWFKVSIVAVSVLVIGIGLMAFHPFSDAQDAENGTDQITALAEALGISVDELEAAFEAVHTKIINEAVSDGLITEEQANDMLENTPPVGSRHMRFPGHFMRGEDFNTLLAEELGIDAETLNAAFQEVQVTMLEQALADGKITQDEFEMSQLRMKMNPYFEEAFSEAYQNAIAAALEDGTITEEQAELLQENGGRFGPGFKAPMLRHKPGGHPFFHSPVEPDGE